MAASRTSTHANLTFTWGTTKSHHAAGRIVDLGNGTYGGADLRKGATVAMPVTVFADRSGYIMAGDGIRRSMGAATHYWMADANQATSTDEAPVVEPSRKDTRKAAATASKAAKREMEATIATEAHKAAKVLADKRTAKASKVGHYCAGCNDVKGASAFPTAQQKAGSFTECRSCRKARRQAAA